MSRISRWYPERSRPWDGADRNRAPPKTVSAHIEHILAKLGATRRTEIAAWVTYVAGGARPSARPITDIVAPR